jgi:hypothetical protein
MTAVEREAVLAAVRALTWAARYQEARALLPDAGGFALARAELSVHEAYQHGRRVPDDILDTAEAEADDPETRWDAAFLRLRRDYSVHLFDPSPDGRDPDGVVALRRRAEALHDGAPDRRRAGWAAFYRAVILDNLLDERGESPPLLGEALAAGEATGDDYLCFEALRHLGDHAREDGDPAMAREHWERSATHAARAGGVAQVLAQQVLLAQLALDRGETVAAALLAGEVARWAGAIGSTRLADHARGLAR